MNNSSLYFGPLIGDNGTCPDRIRIYVSGVRHSVYRHPGESGQQFWERLLATARENAKPRDPKRPYLGWVSQSVHCDYDVPYLNVKDAAKADRLWNYKKALLRTMENDPSWTLRVKAACNMADLLWPQLRKQFH